DAASIGVDGVEIGLLVSLSTTEDDLLPVRRPRWIEAADRGRVGVRAAAAGNRNLPESAAVGVDDPDRAVVAPVREVRREQDLVPLRGPASVAEVEVHPERRDLLSATTAQVHDEQRIRAIRGRDRDDEP